MNFPIACGLFVFVTFLDKAILLIMTPFGPIDVIWIDRGDTWSKVVMNTIRVAKSIQIHYFSKGSYKYQIVTVAQSHCCSGFIIKVCSRSISIYLIIFRRDFSSHLILHTLFSFPIYLQAISGGLALTRV